MIYGKVNGVTEKTPKRVQLSVGDLHLHHLKGKPMAVILSAPSCHTYTLIYTFPLPVFIPK